MYVTLKSGVKVFYRADGRVGSPVLLLLHGFPASSFQYRNIIPLLSCKYRVVAPDLPGFGFTEVPAETRYEYTFANLASTVAEFTDVLELQKYVVYIFDYGAPTGLRLSLARPERTLAIVTQNGNAYEEGLSSWWDPVRQLWSGDTSIIPVLRANALTLESFKKQYFDGEPDPENTIDPATYTLDYALVERPGNKDLQLGLFADYANNVKLYPDFQDYFRKSQVPVLAVWGKNDIIFPPEGALAFKKDLPNVKIELIDGGHFLVESHTNEIASHILTFLEENGI